MKNENLMIGIDTKNSLVKVMNIVGTDVSTASVDYFPYDPELFINSNYGEMVNGALTAYFANRPSKQSIAVYMILPDNVVGIDVITVPTMKKSPVQEAVLAQMRDLYRNFNDLKINLSLLAATKTNQSYQAIMVPKRIISEVYKVLATHKLYVKNSTYGASSALNTAFKFYPSSKKRSFILLDIRPDITVVTVSANGVTAGFCSLPFGYSQMKSETVLRETLLYEHDVAYLAVQNATERAKQTRLSMAVDPDAVGVASEVIDESAIHANALNADEVTDEESVEIEGTNEAVTKERKVSAAVESGESVAIKKVAAAAAPKAFVHKVRRLPAYMLRPIPETQEGIEYENFRIFIKKALLVKMYGDNSVVIPDAEYVLVNLPQKYRHVIERANEEGDCGIKFIVLEVPSSERDGVSDNIDLYGALFTDIYNKKHNF